MRHDHEFAGADRHLALSRKRIAAGVDVPCALDGSDGPVFFHSDFGVDAGSNAQGEGGHVLFFGEHDLDRPSGRSSQDDGVSLDLPARELGAETAADMMSDAADFKLPVEHVEKRDLVHVRRLAGSINRRPVRRLPNGDRAYRFRRKGIGNVLAAESPLRDHIRFRKSLVDISVHHALEAVGTVNGRPAGHDIAFEFLIKKRSVRLESGIYIENRRQDFVLHVDQASAPLRQSSP